MRKMGYLRTMLALTLTLFTSGAVWSQTADKQMCVVIHEVERTTAFALESRPIVSFTESDVKLECNDISVLYSLDHYLKMTIEEVDIATELKNLAEGSFRITGSTIIGTGCESLSLYTIDGKFIASSRADSDGVVTLNISQLPTGTYVSTFGNKSFKIYKRK